MTPEPEPRRGEHTWWAAACAAAILGAWVGAAPRGLSYGLAGAACAAAALLAAAGGRARAAAGLAPALYLTWRLGSYLAEPSRWSPYAPPALLALTAGAWVAGLTPLLRARKTLTGIGILCGVSCAAFMAAEFVVNKFAPRDPYAIAPTARTSSADLFRDDPELIRIHTPGFSGTFQHPEYGGELFEVNADGFRDGPWPEGPSADERRILFLGDSTLVGLGVDAASTIPAIVQARLEAGAPQVKWRVLNSGVPSYGPPQARRVYDRFAARVKPVAAVVLFYDGNDLEDAWVYVHFEREQGKALGPLPSERLFAERRLDVPAPLKWKSIPPAWTRRFWVTSSAFYRAMDLRFGHTLVKLGLVSPLAVYNEGMLRAAAVKPDPRTEDSFVLAVRELAELHAACRRDGVRVLFARLPAKIQAEPARFNELLTHLGLDPGGYRRDLPGSRVLEELRVQGAETVDLLPLLETTGLRSNPNYFEEGHPNRTGIVKIAEALAAALSGPPAPSPK
jgi:lysophospholipase L1-like esterase